MNKLIHTLKISQNHIYSNENRLKNIINFSGSLGHLYIFNQKISFQKEITDKILFVDSRHHTQAKNQTSNITILDISLEEVLFKEIKNIYVHLDPNYYTYYNVQKYTNVVNTQLTQCKINHHDNCKIIQHKHYTLESVESKVMKTYQEMHEVDSYFTNDYNEIAWLLNIRTLTPFFNNFIFISKTPLTTNCMSFMKNQSIYLYTNAKNIIQMFDNINFINKITDIQYCDLKTTQCVDFEYKNELKYENINDITNYLSNVSFNEGSKIKIPQHIDSIINNLKCVKNALEIAGMKIAHLIDGFAFLLFDKYDYYKMSEIEIAGTIFNCRKKAVQQLLQIINKDSFFDLIKAQYHDNQNYKDFFNAEVMQILKILKDLKECEILLSESFCTIAGIDSNSGIIHHTPTNAKANNNISILLLDSGGQYICGTTDITRVFLIENKIKNNNDALMLQKMKKDYTNVLKGHIALNSIIFPGKMNISGSNLDVLARQFLWSNEQDYPHGTGHGVGYCLNVHEGPQGISLRSKYPLLKGMILSNEPGFYDHIYGIRIENLMYIKQYKDDFLKFENLTLVFLCDELINYDLLTKNEKMWIDQYHCKITSIMKILTLL